MKIKLTEDDFAALVAGKIVTKEGAEIIIEEMGFELMLKALYAAIWNAVGAGGLPAAACSDCGHPLRQHNSRGHDTGRCTITTPTGFCGCMDYKAPR